jgi:NAD(P)-dependent dehydrogenase (short-subunit alcohol dehydrogenase family)
MGERARRGGFVMAGGLAGKVTLVTGAGSGIGRAAAIRLAAEGSAIVLAGRQEAKLVETAGLLGGADAEVHAVDITDPAGVDRLVKAAHTRYGRLDVVVDAAGINVPRRSLAEGSYEDDQAVIRVNLGGGVLLARAALPFMREQGGGTLIFVGSDSGIRGNNFAGVAYIASKFGVRGLAQAINAEERQNGIRATIIHPGEVNTPILDRRPRPPPPEARTRMLQPEDVAECIALAALLPPRTIIEELIIRPAAQDWVSKR